MTWHFPNRTLYRLYDLARSARIRRAGRDVTPPSVPGGGTLPLLYLSWGRIGDTVLGTAITRHLRTWFEQPIVMVGRPEVRDLVANDVDRFVSFEADRWLTDEGYRRAFAERIAGEYECVVGDIHLFHGGGAHLNGLIDALPAQHKFVYEGYADRRGLAPARTFPRTATVIPSLRKDDTPLAARHVWHDMMHYMGEVLLRTGRVDRDLSNTRPEVRIEPAATALVLDKHGLANGEFVACQPLSDNPKKDVPPATWRSLFESLPDHEFVLLGSKAGTADEHGWILPNVSDLCGQTSLEEATHLIAAAHLFVGPDSGLTHIAACAGQDTVCVAQSANLGYFFPYPAQLDLGRLHVVHNEEFAHCSGCMMVCRKEPIWRTYREGSLCLRTMPNEAVVGAVRQKLVGEDRHPQRLAERHA